MPNTLIADAQSFLRQLDQNNDKEWWEANKDTYTKKLKDPALQLLDKVAAPLSELTGEPVKTKLFRPYRDVRFSKDKTPYKTTLHMLWTPQAGTRSDPAFFFGVDLTGVRVGTGMMGMDKDLLEDWRKMVDLDGDRIGGIVADMKAKGYEHWGEPALKRVPKPWDQDHPLGDLLCRKSIVMTRPLQSKGDLAGDIMAAFREANPLTEMLASIASG